MRQKILQFIECLAVLLMFGIFAIGNAEAQTFPKTVKFGCVYPLTGPMAAYMQAYKDAIQTAVEYVNENGGIKSLGGAKLEVVYGDSQMKPAVMATEVERLIQQEKVVAIFGSAPSATSLAGSAVAERLQTPFLEPISFADQLCRRGFKYFFELQVTAYNIVETQVGFLNFFNKKYNLNIKRVGIIHEDTDYGKSLARAQRELLPKNGYELVADIEYNSKAPDLSSPILKLKSANPQFVMESAYFADSLQIAKTSARLGLHVPVIPIENRSDITWRKAAGPAGEGSFLLLQWDRNYSHPVSKLLTKRLEEKYKTEAEQSAGPQYQLVFLLKRALENAGSTDRNRINDALHKLKILPGPDLVIPNEKIKFDETGLNKFGLPYVGQIQNGIVVPVWPEKYVSKNAKILILEGWGKP